MIVLRVCAEIRISYGMTIKVRVDGLRGEGGVLRYPPSGFTLSGWGYRACFLTSCLMIAAVGV